jgi:hypothetical protein
LYNSAKTEAKNTIGNGPLSLRQPGKFFPFNGSLRRPVRTKTTTEQGSEEQATTAA